MLSKLTSKINAVAKKLRLIVSTSHEIEQRKDTEVTNKIILVGTPNVGKSSIFNHLSGMRTVVSNYPGTTVEVLGAHIKLEGMECELLDTPGMYSLMPLTEEERVSRTILFNQKPSAVLQIMDARDLERMLPLTLQLIEADVPLILDLNMIDEAERMGTIFNIEELESDLGIPVLTTVATTGRGIPELKKKLAEYLN